MSEAEPRLNEAARLLEAGQAAEAAHLAGAAAKDWPEDAAAWNLYGAALFAAGRVQEAAAAFARAAGLAPHDPEPIRNLVQVRLARRDAATIVEAARLLALTPGDAEAHRLAGAAHVLAGDAVAAERALREAVRLDPRAVQAWLDLAGLLARAGQAPAAQAAVEAGLAANSAEPRLAEARAVLAVHALDLGQRSGWTALGEGPALQAAHDALIGALNAGVPAERAPWAASSILARLLAHDALDRLGTFEALGRRFAAAGERRPLLVQLGRARRTAQDRAEVLAQHRLWGETAAAAATRQPIARGPTRARGGRIALGLLSSDLRGHAVGTFAWPLFEHLDPARFELYVYSTFPGPPDALQAEIAARVHGYRHEPGAPASRIAEIAAADGLDMAIEIGGPTGWNPVEALAWRIAPIQASWLGYPHSAGLAEIDHIILDPWLVPPDPSRLLERPLLMPDSWIAMSERFFREDPRPAAAPPDGEAGFVTFGTANAAYKMSRDSLDLWARVLAATPGSRFLFVRPEAGAPSFRAHALAAFAVRGVAAERVLFEPVRGGHLPFYDRMDVSLDTAPVTGGTTTCESLWMGVPVVSLVGEALYERLSYSILNTLGLGDLAVSTPEAYVDTVVALAADQPRRRALRVGLRERIRNSALGDTRRFASDFYALVERTVRPGA